MQNNFYGSKLNTVLLLILIVLMIFALRFMYQNQGEYLPDLDNTKDAWLSSNFTDSPYLLDIWYPKNYTFNCCGDTEAGTFHRINVPGSDRNFIEVIENENFCSDIEATDCKNLENFYRKDFESGAIRKIDNFSSKNLGKSALAFSGNINYGGEINIYEKYIFKIEDFVSSKVVYYSVSFFSPQEFTADFKSEFLNRLELRK